MFILQEAEERSAKRIYRTALVKLVYFVDYFYSQHTGRTLTGFDYFWDNYGPNAKGNRIVKSAEKPGKRIRILKGQTPSGNPTFEYQADENAPRVSLDDALGEQIIRDVISQYGSLNWSEIVAASKETIPVRRSTPGDSLDLSPDRRRSKALRRANQVIATTTYERSSRAVKQEDLMARYGLTK